MVDRSDFIYGMHMHTYTLYMLRKDMPHIGNVVVMFVPGLVTMTHIIDGLARRETHSNLQWS